MTPMEARIATLVRDSVHADVPASDADLIELGLLDSLQRRVDRCPGGAQSATGAASMSAIRPLERDDLDELAGLYELVMRSATTRAPAGLAEYFARTVIDTPFADSELPSLVYDDPRAGIVGFIACHPRRFTDGDRVLRMACSGQLIAHPDHRSRGVGALLLRHLLTGPQDFAVTDGATAPTRTMWHGLGGVSNALASIRWIRPLAPAGWAVAEAARRTRRAVRACERGVEGTPRPPGAPIWRRVEDIAGRRLRIGAPPATSAPLDAPALSALLDGIGRPFAIRPSYEPSDAVWLLEELAAVSARGELVCRLVTDADGAVAGWYVAYLHEHGVADVVQAVGTRDKTGLVLDELLHHFAECGAVAVEGRVEPHLYPELARRRCLLWPTMWALLHSRDDALLGRILSGEALLTRLEGEAWMGHHCLPASALARAAAAQRSLASSSR